MSRSATEGIDYTSRDYESFRQLMVSQLSVLMPEYTDHSETDAGIVILELLAKGLDVISYYLDAIANETLLPTCLRLSSAETWCNILSYVPRYASPSMVKQVFVLTAPQGEPTVIPAGTQVKTKSTSDEREVIFETADDVIIPAGSLGNEKDLEGNYLYAVDAVQGITVNQEFVGSSDGTPSQSFLLNYSPVIMDSVEVWVNEGDGFYLWSRVNNFVDSSKFSRHYVLKRTDDGKTAIIFGDDVLGHIPSAYENGIIANYRVGGGTVGNVGALTINTMESNLAYVKETFNPEEPYIVGFDDETLDEIKANAPRYSETKWGALTLEDFSDVVLMNFPDVKLATSVRDIEVNPESGDIDSLHIYMLTNTMTEEDTSFEPSLYEELTKFFDENGDGRKIVGANNIYIEPPVLRAIDISADIVVYDRYNAAEIKEEVEKLIEEGFKLGNYEFDQELSLSEVQSYILTSGIEGIKAFYFTSPAEQVITPAKNELFILGELSITTRGGV